MGTNQSRPVRAGGDNEKMLLQMRREASILVDDATCSTEISKSVAEMNPQELADKIDQAFVKNKLDDDFYDPEFMRALSCVLKVGLTVDTQLQASKMIKEFFTEPRQIGANSVEGVAVMAGMKGEQNMFVIKAPRNPGKDNLVHEFFVAAGGTFRDASGQPRTIIGTNWLRKVCLNYSQILGAFRCGGPDIDPVSKTLRTWCDTSNPTSFVNYVIYEKVNGPDVAKLIPQMDATTFVTMLIQLAYALEIAQIYNGFTHYDMHYENVLMRHVNSENHEEEALIPYVLSEDMTVYVESNYIPTIIDYGRCHIQTPAPAAEMQGEPTEHFGFHADIMDSNGNIVNNFKNEFGADGDRARPYYDIYKLIGFSFLKMLQDKNPLFEEVWPIMGFFGIRDRQTVVDWVYSQYNKYYSLYLDIDGFKELCVTRPNDLNQVCLPESAVTMFDFLEYIENQFPAIWKSKVHGYPIAGKKILQCGVECNTFQGALQDMTEDTNNLAPSNLASMGDFRHVMRYRNNLHRRGMYFEETYPSSKYGSTLSAQVEKMDADIANAFPVTAEPYGQQILDLGEETKQAYAEIEYPLVYDEIPSTDPEVISQDLLYFNMMLDRIQKFMQKYTEFKEFYEAGEDMARIAGQTLNKDLKHYLESEISPLYQAVDNSLGEIRRLIQNTPIPPEFEDFANDLLIRTL